MEIDPVILQLRADVDRYQSTLRSTTTKVDQLLGRQEASARKLEKQMLKSSTAISGSLRSLAGTIATYFTGRELVGLLDSFTRLQNNLRVAGVEGKNMKAVQDRLFESAQRYGVELEALSGVFSSISQASKDLGATQEDVFTVTEAVSASLKVMGLTASQAGGALLQLQQVFRGQKVQAQEYNSLIDTMYPLLETVAAGSDRWGGSVNKLTLDVKDSNVTTKEFFDALLKGSDIVENKAAKATLTLSAGFTTLTNALTVYFGEADKSNGVSAALGEALKKVADNLDTLIPAIAVVASALGVGLVTNAIAAQIRLAGVAGSATKAGNALLAAFGGPVGIAITAVGAALLYAAQSSQRTEAAMLDNARAAKELGLELSKAEKAALAAANETSGLGGDAATAEPKIWSFANATDNLTESLWKQAKAARAARIELLQKQETEATQRVIDAQGNTTRGQALQIQRGLRGVGEGDIIGGAGDVGRGVLNRLNNFFRGGKPARDAQQIIKDANDVRAATVKEIERLRTTPIGESDLTAPQGGGGGGGGGGDTGTKKKGRSGPSAAEIEARFLDQRDQLYQQMLSALSSTATSAEQKAKFELESIAKAEESAKRDIENDENLSRAKKDLLLAQLSLTAESERKVVEFQKQRQLEQEAADLAEAQYKARHDELQLQYDLADNQEDRKRIALEITDLEYKYQNSVLDRIKSSQTLDDAIKRQAAIAQGSLNALHEGEVKRTARANETPRERYLRELNELRTSSGKVNEAIDEIKIDGLDALNDGLVEAIMGTKSLGKVFKEVANQIIADLLRIAIRRAVIGPLANAVFGAAGNAFGGGSDIVTAFGSSGIAPGERFGIDSIWSNRYPVPRASGGPVNAGQTYLIGENGPELLRMGSQSGAVIPNHLLNTPAAMPRGNSAGVVQIQVVEGQMFEPRVRVISGDVSVQTVRGAAPALIEASARETIARSRRPTL